MEDSNLKKIGWWITSGWFLFVFIFSCQSDHSFWGLRLNEFGDFLAGSFAPIAFLWFVLAFFQQSKELKQNTNILSLQKDELKLTRKEMAAQSEQLALQTKYMALQVNREEFKDLPRLTIGGPLNSSSGSNGYFLNIPLKNVGGPIKDLRVFSENDRLKEKEIVVSPPTYLNEDENGNIRIRADSTEAFPIEARLEYKDVHGNEYLHEKIIGNDEGSINAWLDDSRPKNKSLRSLKKLNEDIRNGW